MRTIESFVERHAQKRIERTAEHLTNLISGTDVRTGNVYPIGRKPFGMENGDYVEAVQAKVMNSLNGLSSSIAYNPERTFEVCTEPDPYSEFGARMAKTELSIVFDPIAQK